MNFFLFFAAVSIALAAPACIGKIRYHHDFIEPPIKNICKSQPCSVMLYSISTPFFDRAIERGSKQDINGINQNITVIPEGKKPSWEEACQFWNDTCKAIPTPYGPDAMTTRCFQEAVSNPGSKYIVAECVEKRTPKRRAVEWISWNLIVSRLEPWLFLAVEEKGCPEERLLVDGFCVGEKPDALRIIDPQYVPPSQ